MKYIFALALSMFATTAISGTIEEAQRMLNVLGYNAGPVDGLYGKKTKDALSDFYESQNKQFDNKLDQNELTDLENASKVYFSSKLKRKKSKHLQHANYSRHIATPYRDLKVYENFRLIDDFNSFMKFHYDNLKGEMPDHQGVFNYRAQSIDFEFCVPDFISTTSNNSSRSGAHEIQNVTAYCGNMISQRFLNNPNKGIENYRKILLGWLKNGIIENPNVFGKKLSNSLMNQWPYAISSNVPNILTHYALYHKLYGLDQFTHQSVIRMGEAFFESWDYYPLLTRNGTYFRRVCNLKSSIKVVVGTNDHCGSFNARMATGGIYFGLEFKNQIAFDTGVRHLEVMLATFNKDAIYMAQMNRGICAIGYMKQFPPHFELIHHAFQKAFGIDFINTKNINGITPSVAYAKLWEIAHDPLQVVKYWNGFDQMNCTSNGKNMNMMIAQLKKYPNSYRDFWNGFNLEDYVLSSPTFARQKFPKKWKTLHNSKLKDGSYQSWTVSGNDFMGINPYLLQLALGNIEIRR